jgi:hypothetical protein
VRQILQSYRWRRRFAWVGGLVLLLGGLVVAAILLPKDHGRRFELVTPTDTAPAQTVETVSERVRLTAADRRAVNRTLVAFVRSGVTRDDPAAAWDLATPAMRSASTRKEWNSGQLPVFPFPARIPDEPSWYVLSSFPGDLTIDLLLQPRPGSRRGPIAFAVELKQEKTDGRWLVDSMIPEQAFEPSTPTKAQKPVNVPNGRGLTGTLSPLWFIVPGALLALIALVPILVLLNAWRRNRAIERRYRAERGL